MHDRMLEDIEAGGENADTTSARCLGFGPRPASPKTYMEAATTRSTRIIRDETAAKAELFWQHYIEKQDIPCQE